MYWSNYNFGSGQSKKKSNSVKQIVEFLNEDVNFETNFATESEILENVFGYTRGSGESNKKYADMLRRGLDKGLYHRIAYKTDGSRFVYFTVKR